MPHLPPVFSHAGKIKLLLDNGEVSESEQDWDNVEEGMLGWIGRRIIGGIKMKIAGPHRLESANGYLQRLRQQQKNRLELQKAVLH